MSLPGAVLPGPFPIAARKTYGHVSDGMIASARELGLGDEHDGILRLQALGLDPEVGTDAIALLGLDDVAVEVNVTPDRGYAFSIRGIAREYAHSTGAAFRDPADRPHSGRIATRAAATGFAVTVDDAAPDPRQRRRHHVRHRASCAASTATWPTPPWMVSRLPLAGIRSISLVVDITNYVMLELGQPIHGYDLAKVARRPRRASRDGGGDARDARRPGPHARRRRPRHRRRLGAGRARRRHGWRVHRDLGHHDRRARRGRQLGPDHDRAHRAPPQAAERGRQALRARRRPRDVAGRRRPRRPAARRPRRRHR